MDTQGLLRIAVLFHEPEAAGKDLTHPETGNPGVGGTAFCFALLLQALSRERSLELRTYALQDTALPCREITRCRSVSEAFAAIAADECTLVLLRNHQEPEVYAQLADYPLRYVFWMHNRLSYEEIVLFRSLPAVRRVIAVGRQMYDLYLDDPIIDRLDYIANPFLPPEAYAPRDTIREKRVTYVGSLIPDKNFHLLADVWREVLAAVPDATLHVIGSGRLYDASAPMGRYGYAEASYEERFMPGLCDGNGRQLDSVVFHGILGEEKYDIFHDTAVGVINPMATETFGLAAVEMEACGVPIVCRRKNGLCDSVIDGQTGLLYRDIRGLAPALIRLLRDTELNTRMGAAAAAFARESFLPERLLPDWLRVFSEVSQDQPAAYRPPTDYMDNNGKRFRLLLHSLRRVPLLRRLPSFHDLQRK